MDVVLEGHGLRKQFGQVIAVDGLDFEIHKGQIYGFLGPNGAGKTTTLRMIVGIHLPDEGRIRILGTDNPRLVRSRYGYLPEERGLYKKMKVLDLILYFAQLKGLTREEAQKRAFYWLERMDLAHKAEKKCEELSRGMQQKLQWILALVHDPDLLILDEPFSGLDPVFTEVMRGVLLEEKRAGKTVLFSTHVMEEAEQLCDAILLIHKGRKVIDGDLHDVKAQYKPMIFIEYRGDGHIFENMSAVEKIRDYGNQAEIILADNVPPHEFLREIVQHIDVFRFDVRAPSLREIFIRTVGEDHEA